MIGTTDPSKAAADSIRGTLFADPAAFGLATVSSNFNGVHMSAGPLEGLVELVRFFGGSVGDYSFAPALAAAGCRRRGITGSGRTRRWRSAGSGAPPST